VGFSLQSGSFKGLSKRQTEVLRLAHQGLKAREIGQELQINTITVNYHLSQARKKLDVRSTSLAANLLFEFEQGLTQKTRDRAEPLNQYLFLRIDELELSVRTANAILSTNRVFVGDLVQMTEYQLLRVKNFGRKSLNELRDVLAHFNLRLGMELYSWPPHNIQQLAEQVSIAEKVRGIPQVKLGTTFRPGREALEIDVEGDEDDETAASHPITQQLHQESRRKLDAFTDSAKSLDNQYGWSGITAANKRFIALLDRPTADIPKVIGQVYSAALELGSFLELDNQIRAGELSYAESLRPEVRRPLEDLVKTVAPWVRRFPSAREIDNETGEFLSQITLVTHAQDATEAALRNELIARDIAEAVRGLLESSNREGPVSYKASTRGVLSVRNMVIAAATAATTVWLGAVGSELAPRSVVAQRAAEFLSSAEAPIVELFKDLPSDIQLAISMLINQVNQDPFTLPSTPLEGRRSNISRKCKSAS
jgi:DNA-binding CsgD family transcriptional regulator